MEIVRRFQRFVLGGKFTRLFKQFSPGGFSHQKILGFAGSYRPVGDPRYPDPGVAYGLGSVVKFKQSPGPGQGKITLSLGNFPKGTARGGGLSRE
jgi:hypothetical protein